jgi:hypothetical protein
MRPILISQNLKAAEPLRMTNPESSLQEVSLRIVHYQGRMNRLAGGLYSHYLRLAACLCRALNTRISLLAIAFGDRHADRGR